MDYLFNIPKSNSFVVISGHGSAGNVTLLANEYITKNFITPSQLKLYSYYFAPTIPIELSVSSCYSAQFSHLTSESVSVFTISGCGEVNRYSSIYEYKLIRFLSHSQLSHYSP